MIHRVISAAFRFSLLFIVFPVYLFSGAASRVNLSGGTLSRKAHIRVIVLLSVPAPWSIRSAVPPLTRPPKKNGVLSTMKFHFKEVLVMSKLIHFDLSNRILGITFKVHNILGPGLHESAYQEALCMELAHAGIPYSRQKVYPIQYGGRYIGTYIADIVVDGKVILELKAVRELNPVMYAQIINYLKLSGLQVGYLLNFHNTRVEWKRFVNGNKQ